MQTIPLTQGKVALVDNKDYEELNKHKWCAFKRPNTFYAARNSSNPHRRLILMHRIILNVSKDQEIDHKNRNGLDNRKSNLRVCTRSENLQNQAPQEGKTSKFKGVSWYKTRRKWVGKIRLNGKQIHLGYFNNELDAAKTYDRKAIELFGKFARLNFKEEQ